jgi:hypothetical protein
MLTVIQSTERIKAEILADVKSGKVSGNVTNFTELHDYVDANTYGGFCDDAVLEILANQYGGWELDQQDPNSSGDLPDGAVEHITQAQNIVDDWLRSRGLN